MKAKELQKIDIRYLNEKAQRIFEESDLGALETHFEGCKTLDDINDTAEDIYADLFEEEDL